MDEKFDAIAKRSRQSRHCPDHDPSMDSRTKSRKPKLELTWIGKDNRPRLEPRILIRGPVTSRYHASERQEEDIFDNIGSY